MVRIASRLGFGYSVGVMANHVLLAVVMGRSVLSNWSREERYFL
jgi:hypothetical protein